MKIFSFVTIFITALLISACKTPVNLPSLIVISITDIQGLAAPVTGETPVTDITETEQYTGTVTWDPNHSVFAPETFYTATISLSPKDGFTLQGIQANNFTVSDSVIANNSDNSGIITALFPATNPILRSYDESVRRVNFSGNSATVTFNNLLNNNIYLVKVNTSPWISLGISASIDGTSSVLTEESSVDSLPPRGHPAAREFNANPPPINRAAPFRARAAFVPPQLGDKRNFWVETHYNSYTWVQRQATLTATGNHGNIWVMDGNRVQTTTAQAQTLANRFDIAYPLATNILGYEYGGGPGGDGGADGDPKVQILVYDILNASGGVAAAGFFWGKDFYTQAELDTWRGETKTNLAEIFYIDASQVNNVPDWIYSTLIHELQHMVSFNMKYIKHGRNSETWYDEMLSMMTEDLIAPLIGITPSHFYNLIRQRIPRFLGSYHLVGFTEWGTSTNISNSYDKGYAFGAYLLRNYGGADLLQKILYNNTVNTASLTAALQETSGITFDQAFRRFGEAMIYSGNLMPEGVLTFDKTITSIVNGQTYTAHGFDIWNMQRQSSSERGPAIFSVSTAMMRGHSVLIQSSNAWRNLSGTHSITVTRQISPLVEFYLMVK